MAGQDEVTSGVCIKKDFIYVQLHEAVVYIMGHTVSLEGVPLHLTKMAKKNYLPLIRQENR